MKTLMKDIHSALVHCIPVTYDPGCDLRLLTAVFISDGHEHHLVK